MSSDFINLLRRCGYLNQLTNPDCFTSLFSSGEVNSAYVGFDCTASSLHVGSLVQIMLLRFLQSHGIRPIALLGGGTTKVGDPSGKDETRKILSFEQINQNMAGIRKVLEKFLCFDSGKETDAIIVNNAEWLDNLNYIDFLRGIGKHFSVNRMLSFDSVRLRVERQQNMSFLEFNYLILQAYDFVELYKRYNCRLQLGGSDQWGNIVSGIELARRLGLPELFGLTTPLVTTANGTKMGKTVDGAVWLDADRVSPYDYWQYFRNVDDKDVLPWLKMFTELPIEEVEKLGLLEGRDINEAKKVLATEATAICHGKEIAETVRAAAEEKFEGGGNSLSSDAMPTIEVGEDILIGDGITVIKFLKQFSLLESIAEAKRLIKGGGVKINGNKIGSIDEVIQKSLFVDSALEISIGKKKHFRVLLK